MIHFSNCRKWKLRGQMPWRTVSPITLIFILFIIFFAPITQATKEHKSTLIIYQKAKGFSQQLINQLEQDISSNGYQVNKMLITSDTAFSEKNLLILHEQDLLISIGSRTTELVLKTNIQKPILSALIPRHIAASLHNRYKNKNNWSCLLIDQPINRQLNLITAILGEQTKTGILLGPYTKDLKSELTALSTLPKKNISIKEISSIKELAGSLNLLSQSADVLLTLPDPIIYNRKTIRGVLLSAYRKKLPIIGFSKAYVKAGAIAAIYSKPMQISKQLSSIVNNYFNQKQFKQNVYFPDEFSVALNRNIARSLGIELSTNKAIIEKIKMAESIP